MVFDQITTFKHQRRISVQLLRFEDFGTATVSMP
jgi:hypothetical protein